MSTDVTTAIGKFVWHESISKDPEAAKRFYTELFGWEVEVWKPGEMDYAMIKSGDTMHGGFMVPQGEIPSHWMGHVLVEDVDETARLVEGAGGTIRFGPHDIPEIGRFAVIADPQGATLSIFASSGEAPQSEDVFVWDELHTTDIDGAKSFYGEIFGWTATDNDMGEMGTYTIFQRGEDQVAGCARTHEREPMPNWLVYIGTDDVDGKVARAKELGATILMEAADIPEVGRIAIAQDPTGAVFGLFNPSNG